MKQDDAYLKCLFGTTERPPERRHLRAGALTAEFEGGGLRHVAYAGHEILRAVLYVVRDPNWGTLKPFVLDVQIDETDDRFEVTYSTVCKHSGATLHLRAAIRGDALGRLDFVVNAQPDQDFVTNRCGFSVLHPLSVAGQKLDVEHEDGRLEHAFFPDLIAPWQPFTSIRALRYRIGDRIEASCRLSGEVFEMEDQRGWSDASFKTYARPMDLPRPYVIRAGETARQSVRLDIESPGGVASIATATAHDGPSTLRVDGKQSGPILPAIGVAVAPEEIDGTLAAVAALPEVGPQVVLCHFNPLAGHHDRALSGFAELQGRFAADYVLEYVVAASDDLMEELSDLANRVKAAGFSPASIAVSPAVDLKSRPPGREWPYCPSMADIYGATRAAFPGLPVGGGMFCYFSEFNRKRPPADLIDFATHATAPIVHAADDESVMETLATLPSITSSARAIIGENKAYWIGPSTIGIRMNPYGSGAIPNPARHRIPLATDDPRQDGLFAAAWAVGYASGVVDARLEVLTLAAFTGSRGVLGMADVHIRPVFHAVRWLAGLAGHQSIPLELVDPGIAALAARVDGAPVLLVANLSADARKVRLDGLSGLSAIEIVDVHDCRASRRVALNGPEFELSAYAIVRIM